jgi:hypothetical protein
MTDDQDVCQECGGPLPAPKSTGRPRRNCSVACRKRAFRRRHDRVAVLLAAIPMVPQDWEKVPENPIRAADKAAIGRSEPVETWHEAQARLHPGYLENGARRGR